MSGACAKLYPGLLSGFSLRSNDFWLMSEPWQLIVAELDSCRFLEVAAIVVENEFVAAIVEVA